MSRPRPPAPRVFVVHGYQAAPDRHWFPWLAERLTAGGFQVTVVALPDSAHPDAAAWSDTLARVVGGVDADTWFVAHSLGCITVLRYLAERAAGRPAAGVVMVAGFDGPLDSVPELRHFLADRLTPMVLHRLADRVPVRLMVRSDADEFVPAAASDQLAAAFHAPVVVVPGAGHFMGSDGVVELGVALDTIVTGGRSRP